MPKYAGLPEGAVVYSGLPEGAKIITDAPVAPAAAAAPPMPQGKAAGPEVPEWGRKYPNLYGVAGAARETLGPVIEALSMAGGAVLGAGGGLPTGPGALATGAAGAGLGYAGAKNLLESLDVALGNVKPQTMTQQAAELPGEVATGAAMEAGGQLVGKGIAKGVEKVFDAYGKVKPIAWIGARYRAAQKTPFAQEGAQLQNKTGIELTPAQETGDKLLTFAENTARKSPTVMEQVHGNDLKQANQAIERINVLMDKIGKGGKGAESVGLEVQHSVNRAVDRAMKIQQTQAENDFGVVRKLAGDKPIIKFKTLADEIENIIDEYDVPGGERIVTQAKALLSQLKGKIDIPATMNLNQAKALIGSVDDSIDLSKINSISQARQILDRHGSKMGIAKALNMRRVYSMASRGTGDIFTDIEKRQGRMLATRMLKAIEADFEVAPALAQNNRELANAIGVANSNYKQMAQHIDAIENSVLGKMLGRDTFDPVSGQAINSIAPEKIAKRILNLHPSELKVTKKILADKSPETWNAIRRYSIEQALQEGMDVPPSAGMRAVPLSTSKFLSKLPGKDSINVLFTAAERAEIDMLQKALVRIGDRTGANTSGTAITQDFLAMLSPRGMARAGAKLVGLKTIANAMTTAQGRAALQKIAQAKAGSAPFEAAAKAIMLTYGIPEGPDIVSSAEASPLSESLAARNAALREASADSAPARPVAQGAAVASDRAMPPVMNAQQRAAYNAETERIRLAQAGKQTPQAAKKKRRIKKEVVPTADGEMLMYRDLDTDKLYQDDPNEE